MNCDEPQPTSGSVVALSGSPGIGNLRTTSFMIRAFGLYYGAILFG